MNYKLIMLPNPIVVSDEEPEIRDIVFLQNSYNYISKVTDKIGGSCRDIVLEKMPESRDMGTLDYREMKKIIAGIPQLPSIDFRGLSDDDCKKIGWVDVEDFGGRWATLQATRSTDYWRAISNAYSQGFKTAQSLNEKKFSLEDIEKALYGNLNKLNGERRQYIGFNTLKEKLSQPKIFDVEVQVNQNSIKIIKIL